MLKNCILLAIGLTAQLTPVASFATSLHVDAEATGPTFAAIEDAIREEPPLEAPLSQQQPVGGKSDLPVFETLMPQFMFSSDAKDKNVGTFMIWSATASRGDQGKDYITLEEAATDLYNPTNRNEKRIGSESTGLYDDGVGNLLGRLFGF